MIAPAAFGCRDVIGPNLTLLFVGFNPGEASGRTGHHFAGRNNRFWDLLFDSGLTGRRLSFAEDRTLLAQGYGITNIVARPTPGSSDLSVAELRLGAGQLRAKLAARRPAVACYLGKGIYSALRGIPSPQIAFGLQPVSAVAGVIDFVAPSPSGRATIPYADKLAALTALSGLVRDIEQRQRLVRQRRFASVVLDDILAVSPGETVTVVTGLPPTDVAEPLAAAARARSVTVQVLPPGAPAGRLMGQVREFVLPAVPADTLYRLYSVPNTEQTEFAVNLRSALAGGRSLRITSPSGTDLRFRVQPEQFCAGHEAGEVPCALAGHEVVIAAEPFSAEGWIEPDRALTAPLPEMPARIFVSRGFATSTAGGAQRVLRVSGLGLGVSSGARFSSCASESAAVRGAGRIILVAGHGSRGRPEEHIAQGLDAAAFVLVEPTVFLDGQVVVSDGELIRRS